MSLKPLRGATEEYGGYISPCWLLTVFALFFGYKKERDVLYGSCRDGLAHNCFYVPALLLRTASLRIMLLTW
jgi:hypothetical protein